MNTWCQPEQDLYFQNSHRGSSSLVIFLFLQLHKQQSRGELSRHTWHRQESDESSDSVPDEVRSEPHAHSRNFPRSHTFPTMVPSPSGIPTSASASACTGLSKEGASSHSNTERRYSGPATGTISPIILPISPVLFWWLKDDRLVSE